MKCGIITVYMSENCGSFLQSYALKRIIEKNGGDAVCVYHNFADHPSSVKNYLKALLRAVMRCKFSAIKRIINKRRNFKQAIEILNVEPANDSIDCYVLGSDTIWDVSRSFFRNHCSFFWGTEFFGKKVISYAPSIGFAKREHIEKCRIVNEAFETISSISVRDTTSKSVLELCGQSNISIVCDPTYLIDIDEYNRIAKPTDLENFIFLYYYGKVPQEYIKEIRNFAKREGLKTVTYGDGNPWCDICMSYDPLQFLSICSKAKYILTNTFHGTVFSTIYEKRFAVIKNETPKVLDVLEMCAMSDKMTRSADDINAILKSQFSYDVTRRRILKERELSIAYLKDALCINDRS